MKCKHCNKPIDETISDFNLGLVEAEICEKCYEKCLELYDMKMRAIENRYFK